MQKILTCEINQNQNHLQVDYVIKTLCVQTTGQIPTPRSNHISCLIERQDSIFVHGGSDNKIDHSDSFILNMTEKKWQNVGIALKNQDLIKFTGHKCLHFPFEHCSPNIMMFGGWDGERYTNQITVMNIQNKQVRQSVYIEQEKKSEQIATKNTKSTLDGTLFMKDESPIKNQLQNLISNDINNISQDSGTVNPQKVLVNHNILQTKKSPLQKVFPPGVRDHTLVYDFVKNVVFLFGGWDPFKFEFGCNEFNFLWMLDSKWNWYNVKTTGEIPQGRRGHTCVFTQQPYGLMVFGGIHGYNKLTNDCYFLDLKMFNWKKINQKPDLYYPNPRAYHTAIRIHDKIMYYGGLLKGNKISNQILVHDYNLDDWSEVENQNSCIPPLMMHTAVNNEHNEIYIFGGKTVDNDNPSKHKTMSLDHIYILKLEYLDISQMVMSPSPKRQQKEEQLHWNIMAFPALEQYKEDKQDNQSKQDDNSNSQSLISQIQQQNSIREDKFSFDSEVEYYDDLIPQEKYFSKNKNKKKMQYQLSQVIEETSKLPKELRGNEEQNEEQNQSINNEESDDEDQYNKDRSSLQNQDPFEDFPECETEEDGKQISQNEQN
ncbi:hypothetical protein ABPG74_019814 [Tetrahymena malaccensis]